MEKIDINRRLAQSIAWASIAFIVYATLTRVGFVYSIYHEFAPYLMHIGLRKYAAAEHFGAFAVLAALFSIAYPQRVQMICFLVFGAAIVLELAQLMTPDRHATTIDAIQKVLGGAFGIFLVQIVRRNLRQLTYTKASAPAASEPSR